MQKTYVKFERVLGRWSLQRHSSPINLVAFSRNINGVRFTHDKVTIIQVSTRDTLVFNFVSA